MKLQKANRSRGVKVIWKSASYVSNGSLYGLLVLIVVANAKHLDISQAVDQLHPATTCERGHLLVWLSTFIVEKT
jgi:hypothetical protein